MRGWKAKMLYALAETREPVRHKHGLRMYKYAPDGSIHAQGHRSLYKYLKKRFGGVPFRDAVNTLIEEEVTNV